MRLRLLLPFFLVCAFSASSSQNLSVFNIDASGFPVMKANLYAFDAGGTQARPSAAEITVSEDGVTRTVLSATCPPQQPVPPLSLAMSIDVSGSMGYSQSGDIPVELGKTTVRTLVRLIGDPVSEFALQTCNDHALIIQDFTIDRNRIISALAPIQAGGGNDFVEHLLNPLTGLLNIAKTGKQKRVALLYTDAWWPALTAVELQRCRDTCSRYGIEFYAVIYTAAIGVQEVAASAGEEIELPITLNESTNLAQSSATKLTATLRFNATLLDPIGSTPRGTIVDSERVIPLELPTIPESGNVLATLRFRAMLGNDTLTALRLENGGATGGAVAVSTASGMFHLLGVCRSGGARLFNPDGQVQILKVAPNPASGSAELEIETLESGRTRVVVMDMLGREVETVFDGEPAAGRHTLSIDMTHLSTGSYYLMMITPTVRRSCRVSVMK
jgi:hypothetical protein